MDQARVLADYRDLCGEALLWDSRTQSLYWADLARPRFYRYHWMAQRSELVSDQFQFSACALNEPDGFVITNAGGIWLWDTATPPRLVANAAGGRHCAMSGCLADQEGRVLAECCDRNSATGEFEAAYLVRVDTDGSVEVVDRGLRLSHGLAFSPDNRTLYGVASADRRIYSWDYRPGDGTLSGRRVLVHVPADEGFPAGLAVDAQGFLWCAHWFGGCVIRYDPEGKMERRVAIPASQVSSVTFGGPDLMDMFVTSAAKPDLLYLAPSGYDPAQQFAGGPVYHFEPGFRGRAGHRARISLPSVRHA